MKFVIHEGADGQWYVRITSGNNEPWFVSEGYDDEAAAQRSAQEFWHAVRLAPTFDVVVPR